MFYGNGFVRCKVNQSSGCRVPYVTGVRYRRTVVPVSIETVRLVADIPDPGYLLFYSREQRAK